MPQKDNTLKSQPHGEWCRIGCVIKKHGRSGSVKIHLDTNIPQTTKVLFIDQQNRPIPFFIEKIDIDENIAIVKLEEVDTPEKAAKLSQHNIYIPGKPCEKSDKNSENSKKSLNGYRVLHNAKTLGTVKHINEYAPNPLLTVACMNKDILIPLNDYFVRNIDNEQKEITVVLPNGFLTL